MTRVAILARGREADALTRILRAAGCELSDTSVGGADVVIVPPGSETAPDSDHPDSVQPDSDHPDSVHEGLSAVLDTGSGAPPALPGGAVALRLYAPGGQARLVELSMPQDRVPAAGGASRLPALARRFQSVGIATLHSRAVPLTAGRALEGVFDLTALALLATGVPDNAVEQAATQLGAGARPLSRLRSGGARAARARLAPVVAWMGGTPETRLAPLAAVLASGGARVGDGAALDAATITAAFEVALINASARLLRTGCLARASDADLLAARGLGLMADRGGPLLGAEMTGFLPLNARMKALVRYDALLFAPDPQVAEWLKAGRGIYGVRR